MRNLFFPAIVALAGAMPECGAYAAPAPELTVPLTSNDRVGLSVSKKARGRSVAAVVGMWSDEGAVELGGFQDGSAHNVDPATARAAELVSGKPMQSRGVRMTGVLYQGSGSEAKGWSMGVEARRQTISDVGAALSGTWRTANDSRLTLNGKLKF
jgi:hypothetical protein